MSGITPNLAGVFAVAAPLGVGFLAHLCATRRAQRFFIICVATLCIGVIGALVRYPSVGGWTPGRLALESFVIAAPFFLIPAAFTVTLVGAGAPTGRILLRAIVGGALAIPVAVFATIAVASSYEAF